MQAAQTGLDKPRHDLEGGSLQAETHRDRDSENLLESDYTRQALVPSTKMSGGRLQAAVQVGVCVLCSLAAQPVACSCPPVGCSTTLSPFSSPCQ